MSEVIKEYYPERDIKSRYQHDKRIVYDTGEAIVETSDRIVFRKSNKDQMITVEPGEQNRLDLISWKVYGTSAYYWAIAAASGIYDPFNVPVGTVLTCPPLSDIRAR